MQNQSYMIKSDNESMAKMKIVFEEPEYGKELFFPASLENTQEVSDSNPDYVHYHNGLEIGLCVEGSGIFIVEDKIIPFSAPCASVIYQGQMHIAQSSPSDLSRWYFVNIDDRPLFPRWHNAIRLGHNSMPILDKSQTDMLSLVRMLITELQEQKSSYHECVEALIEAIVRKHARYAAAEAPAPIARWQLDDISPAISYVSAHYSDPECSVERMAVLCNMSTSSMRRKFEETVGLSPCEYIHQARIFAATSLLINTNKTILEISLAVGYPSQSGFNRQFQKILKTSPLHYRKCQ